MPPSEPASAPPQGTVQRDLRLDAWRGFFLVIMTIDHLRSVLSRYTYEFAGYVSAAEGFVLLSGYVTGLSFTRAAVANPGSLWPKAARRIRSIYFAHALTFLVLFTTLRWVPGMVTGNSSWARLFQMHPADAVLMGLSGLYQPEFLDILPMYCLFLLLVPFTVRKLQAGEGIQVLCGSFCVWVAAQLGLSAQLVVWLGTVLPARLGDFDPFAWQFLFVCGICWGHRTSEGAAKRPVFQVLALPFWLFIAPLVVLMFLWRHGFMAPPVVWSLKILQAGRDKQHLGAIRLLNLALLACCLVYFRWAFISARVLRVLALLGRHSLTVFSTLVVLASYWSNANSFLEGINFFSQLLALTFAVLCAFTVAFCCELTSQNTSAKRTQPPSHSVQP